MQALDEALLSPNLVRRSGVLLILQDRDLALKPLFAIRKEPPIIRVLFLQESIDDNHAIPVELRQRDLGGDRRRRTARKLANDAFHP